MSDNAPPLRLVWVDLEMTGLNPAYDHILEIAVVVTGADLEPIASIERVIHQPEAVMGVMSQKVRSIHERNGLIDAVNQRGVEIRIAEHDVLSLLGQHTYPGQALLCGRSIDHDWKFLAKYMPRIEQHLHFQRIDVSTMGILVDQWFPGVRYDHQQSPHRAMDDVKMGIDEMRYYCREAFGVNLEAVLGNRRH